VRGFLTPLLNVVQVVDSFFTWICCYHRVKVMVEQLYSRNERDRRTKHFDLFLDRRWVDRRPEPRTKVGATNFAVGATGLLVAGATCFNKLSLIRHYTLIEKF
jgi:hypothetical protein